MRNQPLHPHTEAINHKQKNHAKQARLKALAWLAEMFPQAFDNRHCIRPLKIGIMTDVLGYAEKAEAQQISKSKLREAVVVFTRRIDYLTCLKAREMRIDLEGNPITHVSKEEAERAALKIKRRVEKSAKNERKEPPKPPAVKQIKTEGRMPEAPPAFSTQNITESPTHRVTIKHKTARSFDPNAVARLKQKLGLAQKSIATPESVS